MVKQAFLAWWLSKYTGTFNLAMNSGTSGGSQFAGNWRIKACRQNRYSTTD